MPEANASAPAAESIAVSDASRRDCVGFPSRMYMKPCSMAPSGACSNVVERWIGGASAAVDGSGSAPA